MTIEKEIAAFTFKQLSIFGAGSVVIVCLALWVWYLIRQCKVKDAIIAKDRETILSLMDRMEKHGQLTQEAMQPVLSVMTGVRDAMKETLTIIRERIPRRGE